jgi:hypothetical protein
VQRSVGRSVGQSNQLVGKQSIRREEKSVFWEENRTSLGPARAVEHSGAMG